MITLNDLISNGSISEKDSSFLIEKLKNKSNIIVIGQSNSGKTTLVKALIKAANINAVDIKDVVMNHIVTMEFVELLTNTSDIKNSNIALIPEIRDEESIELAKNLLHDDIQFIATAHADNSGKIWFDQEEFQCLNEALSNSNTVYVLMVWSIDGARKVTNITYPTK